MSEKTTMNPEGGPTPEGLSDAEYIDGIASYYANSHVKELGHHHARLTEIANRLRASALPVEGAAQVEAGDYTVELRALKAFIDRMNPSHRIEGCWRGRELSAALDRAILSASPSEPIPLATIHEWMDRRMQAMGPAGITSARDFAEEVVRWTEARIQSQGAQS